jgi:SAM-dependent methyltransferase
MPLIPEKATVLDIGCGDGGLLRILKEEKACDVYGLDFSFVSIDTLKAKGIPGEVADLRTYEVNGRRAHTVILSHVLEHITDPYVDRVVKLVSDSATDQAFIIVPKEDTMWYEHVRKYNMDTLRTAVAPYFDSVDISLVERESVGPSGARDHIMAHCHKISASRSEDRRRPGGSDEVSTGITG